MQRDLMTMMTREAFAGVRAAVARRKAGCLAAAILGGVMVGPVAAQDGRPPVQSAPAQQQPQKPGVIESVSRWFEQGFANLRSSLGGAKSNIDNIGDKAANAGRNIGERASEASKNAADATKGAVDAMMKLPSARVIDGHVRCDVSPNGAPDCRSAALSLCAAKGFSQGTSIDFVSAEKCPPAVWMARRKPEPGECTTETFVTRAMCQ
jgi:hypothetical protein